VSLADKAKAEAKTMFSDSLKEGWKYLRGALIGALSLYALSLIQAFYKLDHAPTREEALGLVWGSVKAFPSVLREWLISRPYDFIVEDHPGLSISIIVLAVVAIILAALLIRANRILNRQSEVLKSADANHTLVTQAGIKGRYPHATQADDGAPWKSLCDDMLNPENKFVYILGANGIDTFGKPGSPLYEALQNFRGTIRVILCKPDSKPMRGRAAAVGVNASEYSRAVRESVRRLKTLRKQAHSIEARYYEGQPNWKLIITNSVLWVQYYLPGGPHVDRTPVWLVSVTDNGDGFYHLFHMEFDRVWERCVGSIVNLNS
jgi:hypothetical protein